MMKYLRYGCFSILKNKKITFLIILEFTALLVLTNIMVATSNSRSMLKVPYENIIDKEGYYCFTEPVWDTAEQYDEFTGLFAKLKSAKIYTAGISDNAYVLDDEIFLKYNIPLQSGCWPEKPRDEQGRPYVVVSPDFKKEPGDIIKLNNGKEAVVSGVLTVITYIPYSPAGEISDITSFYLNVDYTVYVNDDFKEAYEQEYGVYDEEDYKSPNAIIIVAKSGYYDVPEDQPCDSPCFIVYDDDISDADIKYNEQIMKQIVKFNIDKVPVAPSFTALSKIDENTDIYLSDIYNQMLPIIIGVAVLVAVGLIGSISINTMTQLKNYGIYYLCGSRWGDCLKIAFANISIILLFSGGLSALLLYILQLFNLDYLIGQTYGWNNLIISFAMIVGMILLSLIIPFGIIRYTSPVEVIKSEK